MNITQPFIQRLLDMKDNQCSNFLKLNKESIDFDLLVRKVKEQIANAEDTGDKELQARLHDIIGDATLFAAVKHSPAAVISTHNF